MNLKLAHYLLYFQKVIVFSTDKSNIYNIFTLLDFNAVLQKFNFNICSGFQIRNYRSL
ncbi:hypothetical protein [Chryseobacterium gleum]|uniref:hypothetical protein n=1 Tax=Chryseobacterium gleum TaxID=250 RepID=UPI0031DD7844